MSRGHAGFRNLSRSSNNLNLSVNRKATTAEVRRQDTKSTNQQTYAQPKSEMILDENSYASQMTAAMASQSQSPDLEKGRLIFLEKKKKELETTVQALNTKLLIKEREYAELRTSTHNVADVETKLSVANSKYDEMRFELQSTRSEKEDVLVRLKKEQEKNREFNTVIEHQQNELNTLRNQLTKVQKQSLLGKTQNENKPKRLKLENDAFKEASKYVLGSLLAPSGALTKLIQFLSAADSSPASLSISKPSEDLKIARRQSSQNNRKNSAILTKTDSNFFLQSFQTTQKIPQNNTLSFLLHTIGSIGTNAIPIEALLIPFEFIIAKTNDFPMNCIDCTLDCVVTLCSLSKSANDYLFSFAKANQSLSKNTRNLASICLELFFLSSSYDIKSNVASSDLSTCSIIPYLLNNFGIFSTKETVCLNKVFRIFLLSSHDIFESEIADTLLKYVLDDVFSATIRTSKNIETKKLALDILHRISPKLTVKLLDEGDEKVKRSSSSGLLLSKSLYSVLSTTADKIRSLRRTALSALRELLLCEMKTKQQQKRSQMLSPTKVKKPTKDSVVNISADVTSVPQPLHVPTVVISMSDVFRVLSMMLEQEAQLFVKNLENWDEGQKMECERILIEGLSLLTQCGTCVEDGSMLLFSARFRLWSAVKNVRIVLGKRMNADLAALAEWLSRCLTTVEDDREAFAH